MKALKDRLFPCHDVIGQCEFISERSGQTAFRYTDATTTIEFIPVKYDFAELWRWTTILNRFALSAGNTIWLDGASVWYNGDLFNIEHVYLNGLTPAQPDEPERKRETIVVATWGDPRSVADALPALLPLLGIPVDAVGVVERRYGRPSP